MEEVNDTQHPKADMARVVYMIMYLIIGKVISIILFIIAVGQLLYSWLSGSPNEKILPFSASMSEYAKQIVLYVSFNTDEKPWPSADWPE